MALRVVRELAQKLSTKNRQLICIQKKCLSDFAQEDYDGEYPDVKHMIPGPYPKTEEEWAKAAEKYNLHPAEYKPYPPDYRFTGDYPDLPLESACIRSPYYPWDYPSSRRNYGEPLHKQFDMLGQDRYEFGARRRISDYKAAAIFWLMFGGVLFIHQFLPSTSQPEMEKQYPGQGKHYTFEVKN